MASKRFDARRSLHCIEDESDEGGGRGRWWFEAAMVASCAPVFDGCSDNYEVERKLREAGVITSADETDTETCALVVYWPTRAAGEAFLARLNAYLAHH